MTDNTTLDGPRDLEALLPWYVNGTVTEEERAAIEAWLAEDEEARLLLDAMRDEQEVTEMANAEIEVPDAEAGLAALMRQIEAEQPAQISPAAHPMRRAPIAKPSLFERLANWIPTPGLRIAAVAAGVLVVVQAAAIAVMLAGGPGEQQAPGAPGFQVATGEDGTTAGGPRFLMTFDGGMTIEQLTSFLADYNLRLVDSPAGDIFEVELTGDATDAVDAAALEAALADNPQVQVIGRSD